MLITKSAYISVCSCNLHGHIIFDDGSESEVFTSTDELLKIIAKSRANEDIDAFEEKHLREQALSLQLGPSELPHALIGHALTASLATLHSVATAAHSMNQAAEKTAMKKRNRVSLN